MKKLITLLLFISVSFEAASQGEIEASSLGEFESRKIFCSTLGYSGLAHFEVGKQVTGCLWTDKHDRSYPITVDSHQLFARIIATQNAQIQEIANLRASLNVSIQQMTEAVNALKTVSENLKTNNDSWQEHTLNNTIKRIDQIPGKLAQEQALLEPVIARVAEDLAKNERFIGAIRQSMNQ